MRLLTRFGIVALGGFLVSFLIAFAHSLLGLWPGRIAYSLSWIGYATIPVALLLGLAATALAGRMADQKGYSLIAILVGSILALTYTFFVVRSAFAFTAFVVGMFSCWLPGGISAMLAPVVAKRPRVAIGIAVLYLTAILLTRPIFYVFAHDQALTVALITPSGASTEDLNARPETLGFQGAEEIQLAKNEVLKTMRTLGYSEDFRVSSITKRGKGKKSLAIIVVRTAITKDEFLPEPHASTVIYVQGSEGWEKKPDGVPVLRRGIEMRSTSRRDDTLGFFAIPDASGVEMIGVIKAHAWTQSP